MTFELSGKGYWNSTIKICEAAISMLSACEHQDLYLVDTALQHLQRLVRHGRTLEAVRKYKPTSAQISPTPTSARTPIRSNRPIQTNPHWTIKDETTVDISLPDQSHITAKTICNEDQLRAIIPIIKQAGCFAMDCEFLALKKNQPRLKVLQIAVSKTEGYAIMIDDFPNIHTIRDILGDVLADDAILRLGWAVRADAQAIENSVPDIKLGRILDLQSLVFEDAVETMNLSNAMNKYASSWEGLAEFQYAKEMGNSFSFTDSYCIWLQRPLPPQALVYAVFDVVSLFALYQQLGHLKVKDQYYWPTNVISKLSDKALQKWYMHRVYIPPDAPRTLISDDDMISFSDSYSSSSPVTLGSSNNGSSNTGGSKSRMKARSDTDSGSSSFSPAVTNDSSNHDDDDDAAYLEDLKRAKWLSLQDQIHQNGPSVSTSRSPTTASGSGSASGSASAASTSGPTSATIAPAPTRHQRNVVEEEEYTFDDISVDSAEITSDNQGIRFAQDIYEPARKLDYPELSPDTWGDIDTERMEANDSWRAAAANASPIIDRAPSAAAAAAPTTTRPPLTSTSSSTAAPAAAPTTPKPPSTSTSSSPAAAGKWNNSWGTAFSDRNTGSMINSTPTNDEAGWRLFVEQSQNSWQQGIDSSMQDYDMKVRTFAGSQSNNNNNINNSNNSSNDNSRPGSNSSATASPQRRFNTMVGPTSFNHWSGGDGWETEEQQPDTMTMALSGFKARKTHGPKVVNMYDFDVDDDTDDDSDSDDRGGGNNGQTTTHGAAAVGTSSASASQNTADADTFQDYYYMDDKRQIALHAICRPEHVASMVIPATLGDEQLPLTISIAVQFHQSSWAQNLLAKGLSIYTSSGHAYSIVLDNVCTRSGHGGSGSQLLNSNLGKLLTDPNVRRISWRYHFFKDTLNEKLGFEIGHVVDIGDNLLPDEQKLPMLVVLDKYIGNWPGLQQYKDARAEVEDKEKASLRKFNGSIWDRETLSDATLIFSAAQGAMLHTLDQVWR